MIEPIISLAFSMHANKGVYALLLGSGISRSAGIPTGWGVVEDLITRIARLRGEEPLPDPETWFREKFGEGPSYSNLLDQLAKTPPERNQILRDYFEPDEEDRKQGRKVPTEAHHAIAGLVASGHVRVIATTNFDRLTEAALEATGIRPTVIDTPDKIEGAMPLAHARCMVIKLHGDYMDIRIKNTPEELMKYDERMDKVLDRVLDEYGLLVCGWSAEYDGALEAAIARRPSRRFTTFWAHKGPLGDEARRLIDLRRAEIIEIEGADPFFRELAEKVSALEEFDRPHPMTAQMAVAAEKEYLLEERHRIRLHDLVMGEADRLLAAMADKNFPTTIEVTKEAVRRRLTAYEGLSETVTGLITNGCRWSDAAEHRELWARTVELIANPSRDYRGSSYWEHIRWYPAMLLMYAGGMASVFAGKYENLAAVLARPGVKVVNKREKQPAAAAIFPTSVFDELPDGFFAEGDKKGDGSAVHKYLFTALRAPLAEIIRQDDEYEVNFFRFEYLYSLIHADLTARVNVSEQFWGLTGLYTSERVRRVGATAIKAMKQQAKEQGGEWGPLAAGLFGGSYERFEKVVAGVEEEPEIGRWLG
jgi:hypothetical protein